MVVLKERLTELMKAAHWAGRWAWSLVARKVASLVEKWVANWVDMKVLM
jgi:hypothetical protein